MRDREFVWTWWAGTVPDYFGPKSLFHVARFGVLRIRRACRSGGSGGEARRVRPTADRRPPFLVPLLNCVPTQGFSVSRGLTNIDILGGD